MVAIQSKLISADQVPLGWKQGAFEDSCSLHGLAPYIGRLKSSIARNLVLEFSRPGQLVADPFCGSGTIALEAMLHGRSVFAADCNEYALLLTRAKLGRRTEAEALATLNASFKLSKRVRVDLRSVPRWVREFFHPQTLKDALALSTVLKDRGDDLLLACLLGILHHQRPGFLSYPSSHLVPYLRLRSFPRAKYPDMYEYREVESRMAKKIRRAFSRIPTSRPAEEPSVEVHRSSPDKVVLPRSVDVIITSPPYMNALDYVRDNRLRLWLLNGREQYTHADETVRSRAGFAELMGKFLRSAERALRPQGRCVMVVGEATRRSNVSSHPAAVILDALSGFPSLKLDDVFRDSIPDIRRSRREGRATKSEIFIVIRKRLH